MDRKIHEEREFASTQAQELVDFIKGHPILNERLVFCQGIGWEIDTVNSASKVPICKVFSDVRSLFAQQNGLVVYKCDQFWDHLHPALLRSIFTLQNCRSFNWEALYHETLRYVQRLTKRLVRGCENFLPALAYLFHQALTGSCLARFTSLLVPLCMSIDVQYLPAILVK